MRKSTLVLGSMLGALAWLAKRSMRDDDHGRGDDAASNGKVAKATKAARDKARR